MPASTHRHTLLLNIQWAVRGFAWALSGGFLGGYLLSAGLTIPQVFLTLASFFTFRFIVRPFVMRGIFHYGMRKAMMAGCILYGGQFLALSLVTGIGIPLLIFAFLTALADILYFLPYHAYYAHIGDNTSRGKYTALKGILSQLGAFLGPIIGGLLMQTHPLYAFALSATIGILSSLFFLRLPDVSPGTPLPLRAARAQANLLVELLFIGEGWRFAATYFGLGILVFTISNARYDTTGLYLGILALIASLFGLLTGKLIDAKTKKHLWILGWCAIFVHLLVLALLPPSLTTLLIAAFISALSIGLYDPAFNVAFYNSTKNARHPLYSQLFAETGWDIGSVTGLLLMAAATALGVSLSHALLLCFPGTLITGYALHRYYTHHH